jgi:putative flavoprotein involved in K+ transport
VSERVETVVVGAGQAGLSTSVHLARQGREHTVLERGQVGETWRSQRWDGFYLNTPNWTLRLPEGEYDGDEPEAFLPRDEIVAYFEGYARKIDAPVREHVAVTAIRPRDGGWTLETTEGPLQAANVVVAAGSFPRPYVPPVAEAFPERVEQLRPDTYKRPEQLPDGAVLVVGSGQSGCQIAEELLQSGRRVHLVGGRCPWFPRRRHGQDIAHWATELGLLDEPVEKLPSPAARLACNPTASGNDGGHDLTPRTLESQGATLLGRIEAVEHERLVIAPGLNETLAFGDEFHAQLVARIDELAGGPDHDVAPHEASTVDEPRELDLAAAGIGSVIWATGYRPDLSWIDVPLADELGWPRQTDGLTEFAGLAFVGVHWLRKRKSALLLGVGEDAELVVSALAERV